MPDTLSPDLLARYLSGEATDAERAEVEVWASVPANRRELNRLQAVWHPAPVDTWKVEDAWKRVSGRLDSSTVLEMPEQGRWTGRVFAVAAAVTIAVGAGLIWRSVNTEPLRPMEVVVAAPGTRHVVDLPDGTRVILAPESELRIAEGYGQDLRRVDLTGEAWFAVTHDATRPFQVHAAGTITEDLGTEFLVQELTGDAGVRVSLVSGSASLRHEGDPVGAAVTLSPNEIGLLAPGETVAGVERGVNLRVLAAWPKGRLEFEDASLAEVAAAVTRWYGVPMVLAEPRLAERRFTGALSLDALADALEVLRLSLGVHTERRADTLVVR